MADVVQETIDRMKAARSKAMDPSFVRAFTQATGLVGYDLTPVAKETYVVETPLRNMIPRHTSNLGDTANRWKAITAINTGKHAAGVEEGKRGGVLSVTLADYTASYKGLGLEDSVTFEAQYASENFDDAKAAASHTLLMSFFEEEEFNIFGGNRTIALGQAVAPTVADVDDATGAINDSTDVYVLVIPLTAEGYRYMGNDVTVDVPGQITRTNAGISSTTAHGGYSGKISTAGNLTTAASGTNTHAVSAYTTVINGAVAWAWFWGATANGATLGAITTINSYKILTATGAGTQVANAAALTTDYSQNSTVYDGLVSIIAGAGPETGAAAPAGYIAHCGTGTPGTGISLTADGAGGILEIDTDLAAIWTNTKMGPTHIFMNSQEAIDITRKIVAGGSSPTVTFNIDAKSLAEGPASNVVIGAGVIVGWYLNKSATGARQKVEIIVHPDCPPGMIMYYQSKPTRALRGITSTCDLRFRQDYYQLEWPLIDRKYEYGVYNDGVLRVFIPAVLGMRKNIGTS